MTKRYEKLARLVNARSNCINSDNHDGENHHTEEIEVIMRDAPSGSGIDSGTKIDLDRSTGDRLIFTLGFHHMDYDGYYGYWTDHEVWLAPSLQFGFTLRITGRDRNSIKEYLHDVYHSWLTEGGGI